jgi:hypothetical protein
MISALRGEAATWGGAANLVVPWTADLLDRPELWAIARALDPDAIQMAPLSEGDLKALIGDAVVPKTRSRQRRSETLYLLPPTVSDPVILARSGGSI